MGARPGSDNPLSGPRLPRRHGPHDTEDFGPAEGICNGCGDRLGVMDFGLVREGRVVGVWRLCSACFEWGCPRDPRDGDALTA